MPAVVKTFIKSDTFTGTLDIQRQILLDYEEDVRKYAQGLDQAKILNIYRHIPVQLAKENKRNECQDSLEIVYKQVHVGSGSHYFIGDMNISETKKNIAIGIVIYPIGFRRKHIGENVY